MVILAKMISEQILLETFIETLKSQPGATFCSVTYEQNWQGKRWDAIVLAEILERPVRLLIEIRKSGYPRDVQAAVRQWEREGGEQAETFTLPLLLAPSLSPGSRVWMREQQLAYADASSSLYLHLPWALLYIDLPLSEEPKKRQTQQLFRGASAQVLHALLLEPKRRWHLGELAQCAEVAVSTAHQVTTTLEGELWVEKQGRGPDAIRILQEPGAVLDAWTKVHTLKRYDIRTYFHLAQTPRLLRNALGNVLEGHQVLYALTQFAGAEIRAPHMINTPQLTLLLPAETPLASLMEAAPWEPVSAGGNVVFWLTGEKAALMGRHQEEDIWIASDIQLYLDLMASPARGKEQAHHLRRERLPF